MRFVESDYTAHSRQSLESTVKLREETDTLVNTYVQNNSHVIFYYNGQNILPVKT
jgi:hypothetical protein